MNSIKVVTVCMAVLTLLLSGTGWGWSSEGGNKVKTCDVQFSKLDAAGKGYLSYQDFKRGWEGPLGHKNMGPYGDVRRGFMTADKNDDGRLSTGEYCDWKQSS